MKVENLIANSWRTFQQLISFAVIGILSNIGGYGLYLLLTYMGATPIITISILYPVGAVIGFFANRRFTFRHNGYFGRAVMRYILSQIFGYLLNLFMLLVFVNWFGFAHQYIQAIAIVVVAVFLFFVSKVFVFSA